MRAASRQRGLEVHRADLKVVPYEIFAVALKLIACVIEQPRRCMVKVCREKHRSYLVCKFILR
jgi:hypothetical protein